MSGSDPLELLVWWYRTINADESSNEERVQATQHMEEAKTMMGWGCGQAGVMIVEKAGSHADNLQYFGMHLVEHGVTNHYKDQPQEERTGLRENVLKIAGQLDKNTPKRLHEKVGQVVADMAKHDWPQYWPQFTSNLLTLPPVLVTTTLRVLLDDIKESRTTVGKGTSKWDCRAHLPAARKRELITEVRAVSQDLLSYLQQQINTQDTRVSAVKSATCLIDLVDYALIRQSGVQDSILQLFQTLDPTTDDWVAVCACVKEMCSQPLEDIAEVIKSFCHTTDRLATPLQGQPCPDDGPDSPTHQALTHLSWCLESLFRFTRAVDYKNVPVETLQQLIKCAMVMLKVPSLPIAAAVVPALLNLAKAGMTDGMENLPGILRESLADHISDPEGDNDGLVFPNQSWSEDVYEYEEWKSAHDTVRREGKLLLSCLTKAKPMAVLLSISGFVEELSGQFATRNPQDPSDETGELVNCTRQAVAWESAAYVTSACLSAFYSSPVEALRTLPLDRLVGGLKKAFEVVTTDAVVIASQSALIGGVGCLYKADPQLLNTALDKLFTLMKHRRDFERGSSVLSHNTAEARKRVMQVFVRLASTLPNYLVPLITPLMSVIDSLVVSGELLNNELSSIFEGLVHVSNHMPEDAQKSILEIITKPSLAMVPELEHCANVQSLATLLQTPQSDSSAPKILHLLSSLTGIFRHAKGNLLRPLAEEVVKPVISALQTVTALYNEGKPALPVQLHPILSPAPTEAADKWVLSAPTPEQQLSDLIEYGRSFLEELQDVALELLACISAVTPVLYEHYASLQVGSIANPECLMALRSFFLRFSMPFLYACPPQYIESSAKFCAGLCRLISIVIPGWYARTARDEDKVDDKVSHVLREVSMLSFDVLARVAKPHPTESDAVITNQLLSNPLSLTGLLLLPSCALSLPDPSIATKALLAFKKLLPGLLNNQNVHQHLFVVFGECLQRVLTAKLKEGIEGLIGCDSKEDHLLDECVVIITHLYTRLCQVHSIFIATFESAGVVNAKDIAQELVAEPQEGRRISAVRAVLSQYVAGRNLSRNRTPVHLHIPSFTPLPQDARSCFDDVHLVPFEVR